MGCLSSKELIEADEAKDAKGNIYNDCAAVSPEVEAAVNERIAQISGSATNLGRQKTGSFSLNASNTNRVGALKSECGSPMNKAGRKSSVGQDLNSIMDKQGMLNELVSRQLSHLSHYSVHSENGAVMITPEEGNQLPFKLSKLIGRGGFGNVYLGEWEAQRVAIKIIQGNTNNELPEEADWEARKERMAQMEAILMTAINHPYIVNTLKVMSQTGDSVDPRFHEVEKQLLKNGGFSEPDGGSGLPSFEWHIIMEFCDKGSLSRALSMFRFHEGIDTQKVKWDAWAVLQTLKEVTQALMFLHENNILHGDLKAANVLLSSDKEDPRGWRAKVSDFGLSRVLNEEKSQIKTQTFGTVTHMPPELLSKGTLSASADVYAIGVLMWEMYTGEKVFKQLSDSEVILSVVNKKARPPFPSDVPSRYQFLAQRCWAEMSELRPSLQQLMNELDNLMANFCPDGPNSPRMKIRVYPSRQKALAEGLARMQAQAAQQGAAGSSQSQSKAGPLPAAPSPSAAQPKQPVPAKLATKRSTGEGSSSNLRPQSRFATNDDNMQVAGRMASQTASKSRMQIDVDGRTKSFAAGGGGGRI